MLVYSKPEEHGIGTASNKKEGVSKFEGTEKGILLRFNPNL